MTSLFSGAPERSRTAVAGVGVLYVIHYTTSAYINGRNRYAVSFIYFKFIYKDIFCMFRKLLPTFQALLDYIP